MGLFPKMPKSFDELKGFVSEVFSGWSLDASMEEVHELLGEFTWKHLAAAAGAFFVAAAIFLVSFFGGDSNPGTVADRDLPIYLKVRSGMNARDIGEELQRRGIVSSKYKFWLMAKLNGYESRFIAGSYALHAGMDVQEVLDKLVQGESSECKVVIPEGFTVHDIAKRLSEEGLVEEEEFLEKARRFAPYDYIEAPDEAMYYAEGFLFPATYTLQPDATPEEILNLMADTFDQRLTSSMRRRAKEMKLSIYELVILASLVEKEARYEEDRPMIAQVFFKRLELGMPLQSDASLQYLMDAPKEDVSIADTKIDSPYNTYQNAGLPPGPVANPGTDSIEAVLYPADTDYLYFVADRDGHNHYTHNYADHLQVVEQVR